MSCTKNYALKGVMASVLTVEEH